MSLAKMISNALMIAKLMDTSNVLAMWIMHY